MNIQNLVFTFIFYPTSADLDIAGEVSIDLLIHQSKYCGATSDSKDKHIFTKEVKEQTPSFEKQYLSSDERNNENTQESQEKKTRYMIKENKKIKFKHEKLKLQYAMPKRSKPHILRTVKLQENRIKEKSKEIISNNNLNLNVSELKLEDSTVELSTNIETHKTIASVAYATRSFLDVRVTLKSSDVVTSAPLVECVYQYPEEEQIDSLLSHMTNLLTKLCTQTNEITTHSNRRWSKKRFRVVPKMDATAFERSFLHMVKEFKQSCNKITERLDVQNDPCEHQQELKTTWKRLLEHSEATLRNAALQCTRELLRAQSRADDSGSMQSLGETLVKELSNVRFRHLEVLCDQFQLCYNDLL